ncbi:MAG: c-type cytochrome, partial [Limisphaerales bacterium]
LSRNDKSAAPTLGRIVRGADLPQVRLQALAALEGIETLDRRLLVDALKDQHPAVREYALQLAEQSLKNQHSLDLMNAVLSLQNDSAVRVVQQLAFTLGELDSPRAGEALVRIATNHLENSEIRAAVLSSAIPHCAELYEAVVRSQEAATATRDWIGPLVTTAAGSKDEALLMRVMNSSLPASNARWNESQITSLATILAAISKDPLMRGRLLRPGSLQENRLAAALESARQAALDSQTPEVMRIAAIRIIAAVASQDQDQELLARVALEGSTLLRRAAFQGVRDQPKPPVARYLLANWDQSPPTARAEILSLLVERADWSGTLLEAIRAGEIPANTISLTDRQRLARSSDVSVRRLAAEVLPEQGSATRAEALNKHKSALSLSGDVSRGAKIFTEQCASCHALHGVGHEVGPDLATLRNKEPDYWLQNILDPNAVIEPRFVSYQVQLNDDREISGIIRNETSTSFTIVAGNGVTENILRSNVQKLRASNLSLMPEGLEEIVPPQQMADLLAFVRNGASMKVPPGNKPTTVTAGSDGVYMLAASKAEIYGDQLTFESHFGNIGLWHATEDYITWTVQVAREGAYEVYLDYACAAGSAGNKYRLSSGDSVLRGTVTATGADWSQYKQINIGRLQLAAGPQKITLRPEGAVRGALIDLRTIALAPSGRKPLWPGVVSSSSDVLRDPPSVARFILDASKSDSVRETAVKANPQFAGALITEMTRDLTPGTPEEYLRIPWIWRVAIACGRRNDDGQIRNLLSASLPQTAEPLRDWQAVGIGGGIINGISERGVPPTTRIEEIIGDDTALQKRWELALDLASAMADDTRIPNGTRYDALRMIALEPWEKRGQQLVRYLGKDVNAELQMGAVSGLIDMHFPIAERALIEALPDLTERNRSLALDALVGRDSAADLLSAIESGKLLKASITEKHLASLLQHQNAAIRERAEKLFEK